MSHASLFSAPVLPHQLTQRVLAALQSIEVGVVPQLTIGRDHRFGRASICTAVRQPAGVDNDAVHFSGVLGQRQNLLWAPIAVRTKQATHHAVLLVILGIEVLAHSLRDHGQRKRRFVHLVAKAQNESSAIGDAMLQVRTPGRFWRAGELAAQLRSLLGRRFSRSFRGFFNRFLCGSFSGHDVGAASVRGSKHLDNSARLARSTPFATLLNTVGMITGTSHAPARFRLV